MTEERNLSSHRFDVLVLESFTTEDGPGIKSGQMKHFLSQKQFMNTNNSVN